MKKLKNIIYIFFITISILYFVCRVFFSLPHTFNTDFFIGTLVLLLEMVDNFFYDLTFLNVIKHCDHEIKTPKVNIKEWPEVDIFIATINEEVSLLTKTIKAVKNMSYPSKNKLHVYLCDDGNREEMKSLAKKMKINYITRNNNKDAKAGNYNNALKQTKSPYVAVFDADMCPKKEFLLKTMPFFFAGEKVGFVQTPQCFSNPDIFQRRFGLSKVIPYEHYYFYNRIQIYKSNNNSAIVCGTNVVLLREALDKCDGFATKSVTEDIATGIKIQSVGYKGVAINDELAFGFSLNSYNSYLKQKSRWCTGAFQALRYYYYPNRDKFNLRQQIEYVSCFYYWTFGIRTLIYYLIPFLFISFHIKVVYLNIFIFCALLFLQYFFKKLVISLYEKRKISFMWNRLYETILFPSILLDIIKLAFKFKKLKFFVSPKNNNDKSFTPRMLFILLTHLVLFVITFAGTILSIYFMINYNLEAYLLSSIWLTINLIYLLFALIFDISFVKGEEELVRKNRYPFFSWIHIFTNYIKNQFRYFIVLFIFLVFVVVIPTIKVFTPKNNIIETHNLVSDNGWLSVKDGSIVNEKEETVMLRGVSSHSLYWYSNNYTYDNLKELRDTFGINIFRIAIYLDEVDKGYLGNKDLKNTITQIVDDLIKLDMYAIVDWHILRINKPMEVVDEATILFDELSLRYKDNPNVIYEICNEPNGANTTWNNDIVPYANKLIKTIRNNSPKSIIVVGTPRWSSDLSEVATNMLDEENILYTLHIYQGDDYSFAGSNLDFAIENNIPVMVTECGPTDGRGYGEVYYEDFEKFIDKLENNGISYIMWQFSTKTESSSIIYRNDIKEKYLLENEIYSKTNLYNQKYSVNNYLTDTGIVYKRIFLKYTSK